MIKQTYEQYKKEQNKLSQKQVNKNYKTKIKKVATKGVKIVGKVVKKIEPKINTTKKPYKYKPQLSKSLLNIGAGYTGQKVQGRRVQATPGRPRAVFKHRDPKTGQPIPATVYYKRLREVKRQAGQQAQQVDNQQIQQYARRGISPQEAQQIVNQRQLQGVGVQPQLSQFQRQQMIMQQMQRQQQIQNNVPPQIQSNAVRPIWRRQNTVRFERDIFGNVKQVQGGNDPRNFWN